METYYTVTSIVLFLAFFIFVIYRRSKNKFIPPKIPDNEFSEEIDGIKLGRYYGDPIHKTCVEVLYLENDMVAFRYMKKEHPPEIVSMPKQAFLEKFFKYPNGCDFLDLPPQ